MKSSLLLYIISSLIGAVAVFAGFARTSFSIVPSTRLTVIILTVAGFLMCCFGMIGTFISKAPAHPLTLAGYILGGIALFAGIIQIFKLNVPYFSNPRNALFIMTVIIIIKVIIARFSFLLPTK